MHMVRLKTFLDGYPVAVLGSYDATPRCRGCAVVVGVEVIPRIVMHLILPPGFLLAAVGRCRQHLRFGRYPNRRRYHIRLHCRIRRGYSNPRRIHAPARKVDESSKIC